MMEIMEMLARLANNDGLTLKKGKAIQYKTGYQVADFGKETTDIQIACAYIQEMGGSCGVWFSDGVYYIDHSVRVKTKKMALEMGKKFHQISVLRWRDLGLVYC